MWSILWGGNSAPEDDVYPLNRWYTWRKFAPGACPWGMPREQNPSCVSALKHAKNYHNTGPQQNGHKNQGFHTQGGQKINDDTVHGGEIKHIYIKHLTVFFE